MMKRFYAALATYVALGILAGVTLDGKIRLATLVFLVGMALKTYLHYLSSSKL